MSDHGNCVAAGWLSLTAAPAFALMALLTGLSGAGQMAMICPAMGASWLGGPGLGGSGLGGMTTMYLLMSIFHCGPWLRLIARRRLLRRHARP